MVAELKVTAMILLVVSLLLFCTGASLMRLLTRDALLEGLRDRWRVHFLHRQAQAIAEISRHYPPLTEVAKATYIAQQQKAGLPRRPDELNPDEIRTAILHEIGDRSEDEPHVPWWVIGKARREKRPWSRTASKIVRIRGYSDFISCMWCPSVYVYGAVAGWTWWRVYGADLHLTWAELTGAGLPIDWLVLAVPLSLRWVYGVVAARLD